MRARTSNKPFRAPADSSLRFEQDVLQIRQVWSVLEAKVNGVNGGKGDALLSCTTRRLLSSPYF